MKKNLINEVLSNQFFLLIIGGILTGLLIPYITSQWQNHEKELEIKTNLVSEISEKSTRMMMAMQFVEKSQIFGYNNSFTNKEYNNEYMDWKINADIILSRINAYYPSTTLGNSWKEFSNAVESLYALSGTGPTDLRNNHLQKIESNFFIDINFSNWDILKNKINPLINNTQEKLYWEKNWHLLKDELIKEKEFIIQGLLNNRINL